MGLVFTIMMVDDFDWGYVGTSKEKKLASFEDEWEKVAGLKPEKLGEWYSHVVYDIQKRSPYIDEYRNVINKHCDYCYYWDDSEPYKISKLE